MYLGSIEAHARIALNHYHNEISSILPEHDIVAYFGSILDHSPNLLNDALKTEMDHLSGNQKVAVLLTTGGGVVESAEKMKDILRHFYSEVIFIIPEMAMSAGTILCMSGDDIYMGYASSLGPIDPQVPDKQNFLVPALGYLDKIAEIIEKSNNGTCSQAEYMVLANQDLGTLRRYEQAKDLSITLLKEWLVEYKFKNWVTHSNSAPVSHDEKVQRAKEIADHFCNHNYWHSHGRYISMKTLQSDPIRLRIVDIDQNQNLAFHVYEYHDLLRDYQRLTGANCIIHTKNNLQRS
ncbi:serine dehydrogenasease [Acinetobacter sp. S40]|uniref:SDH family Clp fold serine proteinase n=1 Tax=Acinetobacter sp. S40 TaxID=2767434 RepID=UPI00190BC26B|nr:hypothetical protein [Acinetobacter sp. S40]MBJ9984464.1 serine dehydrogenasease [Acinetobacter sp. S40]